MYQTDAFVLLQAGGRYELKLQMLCMIYVGKHDTMIRYTRTSANWNLHVFVYPEYHICAYQITAVFLIYSKMFKQYLGKNETVGPIFTVTLALRSM